MKKQQNRSSDKVLEAVMPALPVMAVLTVHIALAKLDNILAPHCVLQEQEGT